MWETTNRKTCGGFRRQRTLPSTSRVTTRTSKGASQFQTSIYEVRSKRLESGDTLESDGKRSGALLSLVPRSRFADRNVRNKSTRSKYFLASFSFRPGVLHPVLSASTIGHGPPGHRGRDRAVINTLSSAKTVDGTPARFKSHSAGWINRFKECCPRDDIMSILFHELANNTHRPTFPKRQAQRAVGIPAGNRRLFGAYGHGLFGDVRASCSATASVR